MGRSIYKAHSLQVSERVWSIATEKIDWYIDNGSKLSGYLEPFYNCREMGLKLTISNEDWDDEDRVKGFLHVWVCEARSSDNIMVCMQEEWPGDNKYGEEAYENAKCFKYNQYYEAAEYIVKSILEHFKLED